MYYEPEFDLIEGTDGFTIRAAPRGKGKTTFLNQFEHIAYLHKADGWTAHTAAEALRLAAMVRAAVARLTVRGD